MAILVTGGAGYIGSHMVKRLVELGRDVVVIDDLSLGFKESVDKSANFYQADFADQDVLNQIYSKHSISAVIHFAAFTEINGSINNPIEYYENNVAKTIKLLEFCKAKKIDRFVFSSSASVYGEVTDSMVAENYHCKPVAPYGKSKLMCEQVLEDYSRTSKDFEYIALRYFNVAGAHSSLDLGQRTKNASHLIKVVSEVAANKRAALFVNGDDYSTPDGSCIRDFIHVEDLVEAHVDGLKYLEGDGPSQVLNCGYGKGFSVKEIAEVMKKVSGNDFTVEVASRREGDMYCVVANNEKIKKILNWQPKHDDIHHICKTAFLWETRI